MKPLGIKNAMPKYETLLGWCDAVISEWSNTSAPNCKEVRIAKALKEFLSPCPEGYKLVPLVPTDAMQHAGSKWMKQSGIRTRCYQEMVEAAPILKA